MKRRVVAKQPITTIFIEALFQPCFYRPEHKKIETFLISLIQRSYDHKASPEFYSWAVGGVSVLDKGLAASDF